MSGQNTQKQILAMMLLMFMGVIGLGVYVWFDDGRRAEAEDEQLIEAAERGARLFANNCRVCHGNAGEGLIGIALNTPQNTLPFRSANAGALAELQARLRGTIECGRNGTLMPPWAVENGGSLNFFHIDSLVGLITTNSNNTWEEALALAREQDELTLAGLEAALADSEQRATAEGVAAASNAVLDQAGGDTATALRDATLQLRRVEIAEQLAAEFGADLRAAEDAEDRAAVDAIEAEIDDREADLLRQLTAEALAATDGDPLRALTRARAALAEIAVQDARTTYDAALANVEAGRPIEQASLSLTAGTCGQLQPASATAAGAPAGPEAALAAGAGRDAPNAWLNGHGG